MTTCTHPSCAAQTPATLYLCREHIVALGRLIDGAEGLLAAAVATVAKQGGNGDGVGGSSASVSSAPINLTAMERRDALASALEAAGVHDPRQDPERRAWALARSGRAGDWYATIEWDAQQLARIIDRPVEWRVLGPCGVDGCTGHYRYQDGDVLAMCHRKECRATMSIVEYRTWQLTHARAVPLRLSRLCQTLAAAGVPIRHATARQWVHRGHLTPVDTDQHGRGLYTADQILDRLGATA